ncbi:coiled-coil domain-containing protein 150 isoform X3 [Thamnophis elegans]|uniref:coiled-coil domain-containing protein 150 isoform X3 n=1 Tax=Thamnophis elegans TaxID=35005 RepID=UPI001377312E|nr:coiled-coil domain-containing protein 150 isoform X3 [Thamnophis elegans]
MARPVISPMDVHPTAPETFVVLDQRMKVVEEETNELLKDLQKMGVNRHSMERLAAKYPVNSEDHQSISPVQVRTAFGEANNSLWRTCETLVNRVCRLESVIQTIKLNMFRLQTEKELNPKHAANLEQRLNTIQEEHMEELKVLQMEGRMLCQQLKESQEEEEKARAHVQKLSAALEIATTTKRDITISAEELRAAKEKMNNKLQEIMEKLSRESNSRESLEQGQVVLLYQIRDMEAMVEKEQTQVQILQQDCNILRHDIQLSQERLQQEQEKFVQLEEECLHLKADLESRDKMISKLQEDIQTTQLCLNTAEEKNTKFRSKIFTLQEVASKAQKLNGQLAQQCTELSGALQKATVENAQVASDHQVALQQQQQPCEVEQEKMHQKLKEQALLLDAVMGDLQVVQKEKAQLQKKLEDLQTEHAECKKRDCKEDTIAAEKARLESVLSQTQKELETIIQERNSLLNEKKILEEELQQTIQETRTTEKLEAELTEKKSEINCLQESVKALEKEKREFLEQDAALKHQKLKVQQLEEELQSLIYVQSENNQLRTFCIALKDKYDQLANLQHKLEESKEDNIKMTTILQNVLASHNKMQAALEKVQIELEHKDSDIAGLKKERAQNEQRIQALEEELEEYQNKLALDSQRNAKMNSLRKSLETSKLDKKKLIQNLEQTLQTNCALESKLSLVQDELESKEAECKQLMQCRDQLVEETKRETKFYADRLETLKKQFQTEREVAKKSAQKESAEVKKALEEACSKSSEILRCNKELRAKVIDLEAALANQKEKVKKQKVLITQYFNSKTNNTHNAEKIKEIEMELRQMEELKDLYQKKNYEQSHSIKQFATELTSLQSEMQQLAKNQQGMENQLEDERKKRKQLEEECRTLEDTIKELKKCKAATEEKLKEASIESQQISANLEEAHHWFKSKFDILQRDLVRNRKLKLDEDSEEENKPVKIPSQVCLKRWETKNHLKLISRKYLTEQNN